MKIYNLKISQKNNSTIALPLKIFAFIRQDFYIDLDHGAVFINMD